MSGRNYRYDLDANNPCPGKVFYIDENGELKLRQSFKSKVEEKFNIKHNYMNIKRLEDILKKHITKQGTSIVFNISKAAEEINIFTEASKKAEIEEKISNYKFKLSYIKNVLSDIDGEIPISLKDIRKSAKKRNKKKSKPTKRAAKLKS